MIMEMQKSILNKKLIVIIGIIILHPLQSQCFDEEITVADFPFDDTINIINQTDTWNLGETPDVEGHSTSYSNGQDYTYKLTLDIPANIYLSTCNIETNVDPIVTVYKEDCDSSSWIVYQDDASSSIYFNSDTGLVAYKYDFGCLCSYGSPSFANMIPLLDWGNEDGPIDYYIVVENYGTSSCDEPPCNIRTRIGFSLVVDSITTSTNYEEINYYFSEGVYGGDYEEVYNGNGIAVEISDYFIDIEPNGGVVTNASIGSLTTLSGNTITSNESVIKVNIEYDGSPTGVEEITIRPENERSIYNSVGVPLLDLAGKTITLVDILAPSIVTSPEDGAVNIPRDTNIEVIFSEEVRYNSAGGLVNITDGDNARDCIILRDIDNNDDLDFSVVSNDQTTFTIIPDENFNEYTRIRVTFLEEIQDLNGNSIETAQGNNTIQFRTIDETPPTIASSTLATSNAFATITFNEPVYGDSNASTPITVNDLDTLWSGTESCNSINLVNITDNNGDDLNGGELTIKVHFTINGTPTGEEKITFKPANETSIYDEAGNAMLTNETTEELELNASATIQSLAIADSNVYVDITFSTGIFGNELTTQQVFVDDFKIIISSNGGEASDVEILNITSTTGNNLNGGEDVIRMFMNFDTLPSGVETITISPRDDFLIYSEDGVAVPQSESMTDTLIDELPPNSEITIEDGSEDVSEDAMLAFFFDEEILTTAGNPVTYDYLSQYISFERHIDNNEGSKISVLDTILIFDSPPSITIVPSENYQSETIYYLSFNAPLQDPQGNDITLNYNNSFQIRDYVGPDTLFTPTLIENSYLEINFDDEIYGNENADDVINVNDFFINIISDNPDDIGTIISITDTNSNLLNGGEKIVRVNFQYNFTPSGSEILVLSTNEEKSIYDESGNQIDSINFYFNNLYDELIPSIIFSSIENQSYIDLRKSTSIDYKFSEIIDYDNIDLLITSKFVGQYPSDTIPKDIQINPIDSSINITLGNEELNLMSYDEIYIQFNSFKDVNGLVAAPHSFTYHTPMPGDYNLNDSMDYKDLDTLREAFKNQNEAYELGPFVGNAPHYIIDPDSEYDLDDGIVFVQMWSWYQENFQEIINDTDLIGRPLDFIHQGNIIFVIIDTLSLSGQFQLSYLPGSSPVEINHGPNTLNKLFIQSHHQAKGFSTLAFSKNYDNDTIEFIIPDNIENISLFYEISDGNNSILQKGTLDINSEIIPQEFILYPAFPNPFNPSTTISFDIPNDGLYDSVYLNIYDLRGRLIKKLINGIVLPGNYNLHWDASNSSSGIYFIQLISDKEIKTQKIIYLK